MDITVKPGFLYSPDTIFGRPFRSSSLPNPDLLIGAGHRTHLPLLAGARVRGGRTIVLMKPTLPIRWFDLCIIPAHDHVEPRSNVLTTQGVLNSMVRNLDRKSEKGLFLIGGPSRHYDWNENALFKQIDTIVARESEMIWIATTSRRTPESTAHRLISRKWKNLHPILCSDTPDSWLPEQLDEARVVWVTEDSVSMIYEALTTGAPTGILPIPRRVVSRLSLGVDRLVAEGLVTTFSAWCEEPSHKGTVLPYPANKFSSGEFSFGRSSTTEFNEATRCAQWIVDQWFVNH